MDPKITQTVKKDLVLRIEFGKAIRIFKQHRTKIILAAVGFYLLQNENVQMSLNFSGQGFSAGQVAAGPGEEVRPMNTSMITSGNAAPQKKLAAGHPDDKPAASKKALTAADKAKAAKRVKQLTYVAEFAREAQSEMKRFGIPASVTLAQGLLESDMGQSPLATKNKNHFGIKCFSRSCKKGHCSNFTDDSHKDFFRIYKSPEDSYRAHSQLLSAARYKSLHKLAKGDYKGWAYGLKKAGYATDPNYAEKLIELIEDLGLHRYD